MRVAIVTGLALGLLVSNLQREADAQELRPRAKPLGAPAATVATERFGLDPEADAGLAQESPALVWESPPAPPQKPSPKPGTWSAALDPEFDFEQPDDATGLAAEGGLSDILTPLYLESIKLRLTRHF